MCYLCSLFAQGSVTVFEKLSDIRRQFSMRFMSSLHYHKLDLRDSDTFVCYWTLHIMSAQLNNYDIASKTTDVRRFTASLLQSLKSD